MYVCMRPLDMMELYIQQRFRDRNWATEGAHTERLSLSFSLPRYSHNDKKLSLSFSISRYSHKDEKRTKGESGVTSSIALPRSLARVDTCCCLSACGVHRSVLLSSTRSFLPFRQRHENYTELEPIKNQLREKEEKEFKRFRATQPTTCPVTPCGRTSL